MKIMKLMAALLAVALLTIANSPASARYSETITRFSGDRVASVGEAPASRIYHRRHARVSKHKRDVALIKPGIKGQSDANGNEAVRVAPQPSHVKSDRVCSRKTGACASVSGRATAPMQAMVDDLEKNYGAVIHYIGGWRKGECSLRHQHSCYGGDALDVCQMSRGRVDPKCKLPDPGTFNLIARKYRLYEGSVWCNGDYGHVQYRYSGGCNRTAHGYGGMLPTMTGKMVATIASSKNDEAKAFASQVAFIVPEPPREEFSAVKSDKSKKKRVAARSHKRKYAHRHYRHHRTRIALG